MVIILYIHSLPGLLHILRQCPPMQTSFQPLCAHHPRLHLPQMPLLKILSNWNPPPRICTNNIRSLKQRKGLLQGGVTSDHSWTTSYDGQAATMCMFDQTWNLPRAWTKSMENSKIKGGPEAISYTWSGILAHTFHFLGWVGKLITIQPLCPDEPFSIKYMKGGTIRWKNTQIVKFI